MNHRLRTPAASEGLSGAAPPTRHRALGMAVVCLGVVMIVADNTIVNVALPTLVRELRIDTTDLQWVVASYVLSFASFLLPLGALADRLGAAACCSPAPRCSRSRRRLRRSPRAWASCSPSGC